MFCREHVAELRDLESLNLAFVCMSQPQEAEKFRAEMELSQALVCDPTAHLYDVVGLPRGKFRQMFGFPVWKRGAEAARKGHRVGKPVGDPWRMPGVFVVNRQGEVVWEQRPLHAGDNAAPEDIAEAIWAAFDD